MTENVSLARGLTFVGAIVVWGIIYAFIIEPRLDGWPQWVAFGLGIATILTVFTVLGSGTSEQGHD